MNQAEFDEVYGKVAKEKKEIKSKVTSRVSSVNWYKKRLLNFIPILKWLPKYDFKNDLLCDLIGGLTVGIMHVPQGMAYATLAGVEPIYGLYSSFFAATIYMFFGTSRHVSVGTFAVASMMVGAVRFKLIPEQVDSIGIEQAIDNSVNVSQNVMNAPSHDTASALTRDYGVMTLMSTLTLAVGIVELFMGVFRLSFLTTYISDQLISGYTTATAVHVFVSQLNKVLGIKLPRYSGNGMLFFMLRDMVYNIQNTNVMTLGISVFGLVFLYIGKTYINPAVKKKSPVPVPFELFLVILGIILSTVLGLKDEFHVKIVNKIPQGLPAASWPRLDLLPQLILEAIPIAIICYMFLVSLGKLFAKKHGYKIDPTQELFALGLASIFSSFLPVYPSGAALSRSSVCESSGVKSQFYNVFSGILLLTVIIFIGPVLEPLPMCILSCIVIISLKSLLLQVFELPKLWKVSKYDFAIWVVSCVATLVTTVTIGLFIALGFVIMTVLLRQQWPRLQELGTNETGTVYKSTAKYTKLLKIGSNLTVLRFAAPLCFANCASYLDSMSDFINESDNELEKVVINGNEEKPQQQVFILDCSSINFVDTMGLEALIQSHQIAAKQKKKLIFAGVHNCVMLALESSELIKELDENSVFPSVSEAVEYCEKIDI